LLDTGIKEAIEKYKSNKIKETVNNRELLQTALEKYKAENLEEAEQIYHLFIKDKPDVAGALHIDAHFCLALILLKQGDFIQGFFEYEWRWKIQGFIARNLSKPVWDGSNFLGKTLLVYTEQGLGDSIQFIRYIPLVKKLGGRVIFECNQAGLKFLFTTVSEIDELFVEGEKLPEFDLQIPLMSLPRIFQTTLENIPADMESQHNLSDLPANFDQAYQYYQQNNLVEAEKICRRILTEKPEDFHALHLIVYLLR